MRHTITDNLKTFYPDDFSRELIDSLYAHTRQSKKSTPQPYIQLSEVLDRIALSNTLQKLLGESKDMAGLREAIRSTNNAAKLADFLTKALKRGKADDEYTKSQKIITGSFNRTCVGIHEIIGLVIEVQTGKQYSCLAEFHKGFSLPSLLMALAKAYEDKAGVEALFRQNQEHMHTYFDKAKEERDAEAEEFRQTIGQHTQKQVEFQHEIATLNQTLQGLNETLLDITLNDQHAGDRTHLSAVSSRSKLRESCITAMPEDRASILTAILAALNLRKLSLTVPVVKLIDALATPKSESDGQETDGCLVDLFAEPDEATSELEAKLKVHHIEIKPLQPFVLGDDVEIKQKFEYYKACYELLISRLFKLSAAPKAAQTELDNLKGKFKVTAKALKTALKEESKKGTQDGGQGILPKFKAVHKGNGGGSAANRTSRNANRLRMPNMERQAAKDDHTAAATADSSA